MDEIFLYIAKNVDLCVDPIYQEKHIWKGFWAGDTN